ncbi:uncharacterized protein PgNI_05063 [Pyricularia grisea]|uniref:Uncharacterized protein n=1 Tax=Pyricularia grisea TaxID=148305 RepID=A0A6P8B8L2_PYRGI|nr:uncharacterized protein PgNI_05063 [Pyricularia grisea]TLD11987.1 hypothetical protein PgNI_05063 [Pyricularia grisea]
MTLKATTNKAGWSFPAQFGNKVTWVLTARCVVDGNIWSSSGISAAFLTLTGADKLFPVNVILFTSIDITYAFFSMVLGSELTGGLIKSLECVPHTNKDWDPYSVPGADISRRLGECVAPAGYEFTVASRFLSGHNLL